MWLPLMTAWQTANDDWDAIKWHGMEHLWGAHNIWGYLEEREDETTQK